MKKIITIIVAILALFFVLSPYINPIRAFDPMAVPNNIYGIGIVNHSDLEDVSNLVNVNGGDWGYVTIVITEGNMDKDVWQKFMDDCRRLHIIPIIRIATSFTDENWNQPKIESIDKWINFFNSLNWVIENRYIVIGNEPNHSKEWGGTIDPSSYAIYLRTFAERLHNASTDYFVLNAAFDQAASNSKVTMDEKKYIDEMTKTVPDIFNYIDGWNSHSYPNPAFSGSKTGIGRKSIRGYDWELSLIKKSLPVFITETGWVRKANSEQRIADSLKYAYEEVWNKDKRIVAVTPFILNYQADPFYEFSWKNKDNSYFSIYNKIQDIPKIKGKPIQKISGEIIFNFLNPLMINNETKGFSIVKNTGQATWSESDISVSNDLQSEISIDTQIDKIEPFNNGLVVYTLKSNSSEKSLEIKLGFYVQDKHIGDLYNGKIISF